MSKDDAPVSQGHAPPSPPLRNLTHPGDASELMKAAAGDIDHFGFCLVLADSRLSATSLPPALPQEILEAEAFPDAAAGPRGSGMILRRCIARNIASLATGYVPEAFPVTRNAAGAPIFSPAPAGSGLHLSFSARGPFGLIALSHRRIGADIEMPVAESAIPWNVLTSIERDTLRALDHARAQAFQRLWAAKEASAKLLGIGFALPPESIALAGWEAETDIFALHIAGLSPAESTKIRFNTYRVDLKFAEALLKPPPTGGLVVVAACGALF